MGISKEQALDCFRSDDLVGIGMEADAVRRRLHPEGAVGYVVETAIDCAGFGASADGSEAIAERVEQAVAAGSSSVVLRSLGAGAGEIGELEQLVRSVKRRSASVWLRGFSTAELLSLADSSRLDVAETLARLCGAGLDSLAADCTGSHELAAWSEVHAAAHALGMRTEAAMVFGVEDSLDQRIDALEAVRRMQEETGGFTAFVPLYAAAANGRELDGTTAVESLKTLAVSRMVLESIDSVQSSWATSGLKVRQMGLRFGANDVGPVAPDMGGEEDLRRVIRDAGFRPVERDAAYRMVYLG